MKLPAKVYLPLSSTLSAAERKTAIGRVPAEVEVEVLIVDPAEAPETPMGCAPIPAGFVEQVAAYALSLDVWDS